MQHYSKFHCFPSPIGWTPGSTALQIWQGGIFQTVTIFLIPVFHHLAAPFPSTPIKSAGHFHEYCLRRGSWNQEGKKKKKKKKSRKASISFWFSKGIILFFFFRDKPAAYGSSQTRGWIRAIVASLHHSHSNTGSELCLWPTPQFTATGDP